VQRGHQHATRYEEEHNAAHGTWRAVFGWERFECTHQAAPDILQNEHEAHQRNERTVADAARQKEQPCDQLRQAPLCEDCYHGGLSVGRHIVQRDGCDALRASVVLNHVHKAAEDHHRRENPKDPLRELWTWKDVVQFTVAGEESPAPPSLRGEPACCRAAAGDLLHLPAGAERNEGRALTSSSTSLSTAIAASPLAATQSANQLGDIDITSEGRHYFECECECTKVQYDTVACLLVLNPSTLKYSTA
jgi:hypothetical protein